MIIWYLTARHPKIYGISSVNNLFFKGQMESTSGNIPFGL